LEKLAYRANGDIPEAIRDARDDLGLDAVFPRVRQAVGVAQSRDPRAALHAGQAADRDLRLEGAEAVRRNAVLAGVEAVARKLKPAERDVVESRGAF
jgi:hypothetical protein